MAEAPEGVIQQIGDNKIAPVYFLQGSEPYYIDKITNALEEKVIPEDQKGFNEIHLYGQDISLGDAINAARRFPMMYDRQLVLIKEAQGIKDLTNKDTSQLLLKYVEKPLPSTVLVFAYKGKKLDGKTTLMKTLDKKAVVVNSEPVPDYKFAEWINKYFKAKGFKSNPDAVQMLSEHIGSDLQRFENEIHKLLLNITTNEQITPALIEKYVGISKTYNVFELQKSFGMRQPVKAMQILKSFSQGQQEIYPVLGNLYNYFSRLVLVHQSTDKSEQELSKVLGVHPFITKEYKIAAQNYSLGKALSALLALSDADIKVKGIDGAVPPDFEIYKELVFKIMA